MTSVSARNLLFSPRWRDATFHALSSSLLFALATVAVAGRAHADRVDDFVSKAIVGQHIPGLSLAVVREGKLVKARGYGLANVELAVPATELTVYQIASVTKPFTAEAVMILVDQGKLSLNDRIGERLADLPTAWHEVTIRHLLSHTSGIPDYTNTPAFQGDRNREYRPRELVAMVTEAPLEFSPGDKWNYSNTGYVLLGLLIEEASGQPYGEFLDEHIFKPLGMTSARTNDLGAIVLGRAQGYGYRGAELRNGAHISPTQAFSAGMIASNVVDLARWSITLVEGRLLPKPVAALMESPTKLAGGQTAEYGLGWNVQMVNDHRFFSHSGGIPGFASQVSRYPDDGLTVIVLTNTTNMVANAGRIAEGVASCYLPAIEPVKQPPIADPDPKLTERLKGAVEQVVHGNPHPQRVDEALIKRLAPLLRANRDHHVLFGNLLQLDLLGREVLPNGLRLRYRAVFEGTAVIAIVDVDKAGTVVEWGLQSE